MSDRTLDPGFLALATLVRVVLVADHETYDRNDLNHEDADAFTAVDVLLAHPRLLLDALVEGGGVRRLERRWVFAVTPVYVVVTEEKGSSG